MFFEPWNNVFHLFSRSQEGFYGSLPPHLFPDPALPDGQFRSKQIILVVPPEKHKLIPEHLCELLHSLEEPYREVFTLRTFCDLSHTQIAELFRKSESWSRVTYYRARRMIQDAMEENRDEKE